MDHEQPKPRWEEWFDYRTLEVVREEFIDGRWMEVSRTHSPESSSHFRPPVA